MHLPIRFQGARLLLVALLVALLCLAGALPNPLATGRAWAAAPTAIAGLHVAGNTIVNDAGQPVRLLGVDRSGTEYQCIHDNGIFDGPSDAASAQAIAAWHTNAVRVPLNEDCWLGINGAPAAYSGANYQQAIVNYVNLLNQNGLVAILDLHWNAPGAQQATGQQPMPDQDHAPAFWTSVANTFKGNSSIIFDLYNEPYPDSNQDSTAGWQCWLNGGSCPGVSFQAAGMQELVNTVRNTGATNIVMLGGLEYSNDLSQWLTYKPSDPTGNLAASWHVYNFNVCNNTSCYDSQIAPVARQVPVIAGEIGENDCAHGFIDTLMGWLDAHNGAYLGWAWDTHDCSSFPALISDYSGTPTAFGVGLKNHLAALAAGSPTATPNPTNTPPAQPTNTPQAKPTNTPAPANTATATPRPANMATATPSSGGSGAVTARGSVTGNSGPYWGEEDVTVANSAPMTALRITVTVQKTSGVSYSGQYNTYPGGVLSMGHTDTGGAIVYTYTLNAGQTVPTGANWIVGSQYGGNGATHPTSGDTYSVSATAGGATTTASGHF